MIDVPIVYDLKGRRRFPVGFRIEFLKQWDQALERNAKMLLLREFNLTYPTVLRWLRSRASGELEASLVKAAGSSRSAVNNRERAELARLKQENEHLRKKVEQAEAVQEILGKAFGLLEGITKSTPPEHPQIPISLMSAAEYERWLHRQQLS